jgi:peptide-methionine (S)-S-oxide reductase
VSIISMVKASPARSAAVGLGALLVAAFGSGQFLTARAADLDQRLPLPAVSEPASTASSETVVFAGGCFWGVQGVFEHVKGVTRAVSGYAGGHVANPDYEQVSSGDTGHAESVRVTFDPAQVSYGTLLRIFFSVALDPTQKDRQGPDTGTQYRSELFVSGPEQERVAKAYVAQLEAAHVFSRPIATRIDPAGPFYPAEAYHQDYLDLHPDQPYIAINDIPKVQALQALFPDRWQPTPVRVGRLASGD